MTIASRALWMLTTAWLATAWLAVFPATATAQYPDKPIRLIVPYPAGGAGDMMARTLAEPLGDRLGQRVLIENKGGAGGSLAAEAVARSSADGYTLLFGTMGTQTINPSLYPTLSYDPIKDFAPIALTHTTPRVMIVHARHGVSSVAELIALAKAQPGKLVYGSAGSGSSSHLAGALLATMAGIDMVHVPYRGSAPLLTDLLGGRIDIGFEAYALYQKHIEAGTVRLLAVTSKDRMASLPNTPTIAESGFAGYDVSNWLGVLAPAGTPTPVIAQIHKAISEVTADPALRTRLADRGITLTTSTPAEFATLIREDIPRWSALVRSTRAKAD